MLRQQALLAGVTRLFAFVAGTRELPRQRHRVCRVNGRLFMYGEASSLLDSDVEGAPEPVVLLVHGWGLSHASYRRAAEALAAQGFRVISPDLPGSGWTGDLPMSAVSFAGMAQALREFAESVLPIDPTTGERQKVHVVGHSMGGAVGLQLAHDAPELVSSLVLVAAASGVTWSRRQAEERLLTERPLWDWAFHLLTEFPVKDFPLAARPVLRDLRHNLVWHLPSLGMAAHITRRSDLRAELSAVVDKGIPVRVVRASGDRVVTEACYHDQCIAAACEGVIVDGNHGWPFTDPDEFARVTASLLPLAPS